MARVAGMVVEEVEIVAGVMEVAMVVVKVGTRAAVREEATVGGREGEMVGGLVEARGSAMAVVKVEVMVGSTAGVMEAEMAGTMVAGAGRATAAARGAAMEVETAAAMEAG